MIAMYTQKLVTYTRSSFYHMYKIWIYIY